MVFTSKSNPLIKKYASLKEKKFRLEHGLFLAEGFKMVKEVLSSPMRTECVIVSEDYKGERYTENCIEVSAPVFSYLSDERTPQGILAVVKIPERRVLPPKGNCLLLDGIRDPGNLGTILRTANAAGYKEIYLLGCTDPYAPKCVRAAMSGLFFVDLYEGSGEEIFSALAGVPVLSADMAGEDVFSFTPPPLFALAVGNEANGITPEVERRSFRKIRIPMEENSESLNAGVSAGILMYLLKHNQNIKK